MSPDSYQDVGASTGSGDDDGGGGGSGSGSGATPAVFAVTELVTNATDPDLVNPWGIVGGEGVFWIADEATGKVSVYDGAGHTSEEYPTSHFDLGEGITGVAHNEDDEAFLLDEEDDHGGCGGGDDGDDGGDDGDDNDDEEESNAAEFIFASEEGKLIAINDDAPVSGVTVVDRSSTGAVYLGTAIIEEGDNGPLLLASDFANARIDVFDANFKFLSNRMFVDPQVPEGYGPFNVRVLDDRVYVMYAKQSEDEPDEEEAGPGLGAIAVFDTSGHLLSHVQGGALNAPWGATIIGDTLYIGNFGDGHISMFDVSKLSFLGQLSDQAGQPLELEGLWGLEAGGDDAGMEGVLYFVAGPEDETAGVFGRIEQVIN